MIDIKIFTYREGGQGVGRERVEYFFFTHYYCILFYQCNNKNIIYQQLLLVTLYILHIVYIVIFFHSPEKLTFGCKKCIFSTVFYLDG